MLISCFAALEQPKPFDKILRERGFIKVWI
jgi:hypothetical protein